MHKNPKSNQRMANGVSQLVLSGLFLHSYFRWILCETWKCWHYNGKRNLFLRQTLFITWLGFIKEHSTVGHWSWLIWSLNVSNKSEMVNSNLKPWNTCNNEKWQLQVIDGFGWQTLWPLATFHVQCTRSLFLPDKWIHALIGMKARFYHKIRINDDNVY